MATTNLQASIEYEPITNVCCTTIAPCKVDMDEVLGAVVIVTIFGFSITSELKPTARLN